MLSARYIFAAALLITFALPAAHAQVYPAKPVRLIVPYPAGGGTDFFVRSVAALPELPTVSESGFPGFEAWAWQALAVPAGTPKDIVAKLNVEYRMAIGMPELRQKLIDAGIEPLQSSSEEASAYMRSEAAKWAKVIGEGKITVE